MNTNLKKTMSWAAAVALVGGGAFAATAQAQALPGASTVTAATDAELAKSLQFMREEERMARDLYKAFADLYDDAVPFSRITVSEDRHYDAVGTLLDRFDVADPSTGKAAGTYADATIQKLYTDWLAQGKKSVDAAYDVGVALETRDIADLKAAINDTSDAYVKQVYTNLLGASEQHLRAYQAAADGKVLGTQDGTGRMNRWGDDAAGRPGMGGRMGGGGGMGRMGDGTGAGNGPGGYGMTGERPADCPMLDDTDAS
jgi:hypothetical protein